MAGTQTENGPAPLQTTGRLADWFAGAPAAVPGQWLGRFLILRLLGLVYLMAFLTLALQGPALIGPDGLEPARLLLDEVAASSGGRGAGFWQLPSLFWLGTGDGALRAAGWLGAALSLAVLAGWANAIILALLCALQISITAVGGTFYGFGWELQLVETGFLCTFLCPLLDGRAFPRRAPPRAVIFLLRWLAVRIMWGAGLIKLRGDPCWRELTCLDFHFETQPIPNPLSLWFHRLPHGVHEIGVAFNHVVEVIVPFFVFGPRRVRIGAALLLAALQVILLASGNLSFLNWLTLVPILACLDDGVWRAILPRALVARAARARVVATHSRPMGATAALVTLLVAVLSVAPVLNLISGRQLMNSAFTRLPLVNTYGAFGTVGRVRDQLVVEGTDEPVITTETRWRPYAFECQPGDPRRRPCWMSPYHYRLDWLMWFAAMGRPRDYPWAVNLVAKLLAADPNALSLLAGDPFGGTPPRFVRVEHYVYQFVPRGAPGWWRRTHVGPWLPPVSRDNEELRAFLRAAGLHVEHEAPDEAP
jgi:hypothetical protein